jgi:hypothetical protein
MTTEFAGALVIEPPLSRDEVAYVRRLSADGTPESMPWVAARDGTLLRARGHAEVATALASLRLLVGSIERPSRFRGTVAVYDSDVRELVALTVANGRVTMRNLRRRRPAGRSNVIELAARRRTVSRANVSGENS